MFLSPLLVTLCLFLQLIFGFFPSILYLGDGGGGGLCVYSAWGLKRFLGL